MNTRSVARSWMSLAMFALALTSCEPPETSYAATRIHLDKGQIIVEVPAVDVGGAYVTQSFFSDVRPFLGIDNLFDERYNSSIITNAFGGRYFEPSPDREFYVGLTIGAGVR